MHAVEGIACRQLISHASDRNKTQWPNQNHHILPYPSHPSVAQSNPLLPIEIRPSGPTNTITSVSSICRAIESISADRNKTYLVALPTPSHDRILFVSHLIHHPKYLDSWLAHLKMLLWHLCLRFAQSMSTEYWTMTKTPTPDRLLPSDAEDDTHATDDINSDSRRLLRKSDRCSSFTIMSEAARSSYTNINFKTSPTTSDDNENTIDVIEVQSQHQRCKRAKV